MPIAYRSSSHTGNSQNVPALQVAVPTGATDRDVVVCILSRWETFTHPPVTVPEDFFPFGNEVVSGDGNGRLQFFYKRLSATDTGTYDFSWGSAMLSHIHAVCFTNVVKSGDPVGSYFQSASAVTSYPIAAMSQTTPFVPGLVWTCFVTTAGNAGVPTAGFTEVADSGHGCTVYQVPAAPGGYTVANAGATPQSPSAAAYFALASAMVYPDGHVPVASGFEGDLGFAGLGRRYEGVSADACSADADLTVSGRHVLYDSISPAAADIPPAELSVVAWVDLLLLDGTAADAAGSVSDITLTFTRGLFATLAVAGDATGDLTTGPIGSVSLDGLAETAGELAGDLTRTWTWPGTVAAAGWLAGELDVTASAAPVEFSGLMDAASELGGDLGVAVALDASLPAAADASAELARDLALDGLVDAASDAAGELAVQAPAGLDGSVDAAAWADGALTVVVFLDGSATAAEWAGAELALGLDLAGSVEAAEWAGAELVLAVPRDTYVSLGPRRWGAELAADSGGAALGTGRWDAELEAPV